MTKFENGTTEQKPRTLRPADHAIARDIEAEKAAEFASLFGEVGELNITQKEGIAGSEKEWVRNIDTKGPPSGFNEFGWKPWSTNLITKNFAMLQKALEAIHLDPAQRATMTGYILNNNYDIRTGHADVKEIRIIPEETEGRCTLEFTYDRYRDVRHPKELSTSDQTSRISIQRRDFTNAEREGYLLPGITKTGIDQQELAKTLRTKQESISGGETSRAHMSYDVDRGVIIIHTTTIGRGRTGRISSQGTVPAAVIEATEFMTPAEIELIGSTKIGNARHAAVEILIQEKANGWSLAEYAELRQLREADRTIETLGKKAARVVSENLAEKLQEQAKADAKAAAQAEIKSWRESIFYEAMKQWKFAYDRASSGIGKMFTRESVRQEREAVAQNAARQEIWNVVKTMKPRATAEATTDWIGGYTAQGTDAQTPQRADAVLEVRIEIAQTPISLSVSGLKTPLAFTQPGEYKKQKIVSRAEEELVEA